MYEYVGGAMELQRNPVTEPVCTVNSSVRMLRIDAPMNHIKLFVFSYKMLRKATGPVLAHLYTRRSQCLTL